MSSSLLPNEIIHRILDNVDPGGLVSFILTSRTAHSISGNAIRQHQLLIKQYSTLQFGYSQFWCEKYEPKDHFSFFYDKLLSNPEIAWYPRTIQAASCIPAYWASDDEEFTWDQEDKVLDVVKARSSELTGFGASNPWINEETQREKWRKAICDPSNEFYHLAMLLKMRPNLQVVQLVGMSWDNKPLKEMIWAIAAANQDLASLLQGKALAHLTAIDIIANDIEGDEDIHLYTPFAALPALRSIHGRQINGIVSDLYGDRSESVSSIPQTGYIEEIFIDWSAIDMSN